MSRPRLPLIETLNGPPSGRLVSFSMCSVSVMPSRPQAECSPRRRSAAAWDVPANPRHACRSARIRVPRERSCRPALEREWMQKCRYSIRRRAPARSGAHCCLPRCRSRTRSADFPLSVGPPVPPRPAREQYCLARCHPAISARLGSPTKPPRDAAASMRRRWLRARIFLPLRAFPETRSGAHRSARRQCFVAPPESFRTVPEWWRNECASSHRPARRSHADAPRNPHISLDDDKGRIDFNDKRRLQGNSEHVQSLRRNAVGYDGVADLHGGDRVDASERMRALTPERNFDAAITLLNGQAVIAVFKRRGAGRLSLRRGEGFADGPCLGIPHCDVVIFLRVHADQFFVLLVLEHELVIAVIPLGRVGLQSGLCLVVGKRVGMLVVAIVHATGHKRPVGITFEELDHDLHPDPRNELLAPLLAGPGLGNPDRAGLLRLAIPIELHPDVTVFVGRYLLAVLALLGHDFRGLDTVDARCWCQRQTPKRAIARQEFVVPVVGGRISVLG